MVIRGQDVIITEDDGTAIIAAAKSHTLDIQCEELEKTSEESADFKAFLAGRKEWTVNISHLIGDAREDSLRVGQTYEIYEYNRKTRQMRLMGDVICTRASINLTKGNLATGALSFRGNGEIYPSPSV